MAAAHPLVLFVGCRFKRIGIAHFARPQETTSQCALTLSHVVFRVLRLPALLDPALSQPASQCAPGLRVFAARMRFTCGWIRSEDGRRSEVSYVKKLFMENM